MRKSFLPASARLLEVIQIQLSTIKQRLCSRKEFTEVCAPTKTRQLSVLVDFDDPFNKYLKNHAQQGKAIIQHTDGFKENIVEVLTILF